MKVTVYQYPKCGTSRKALKWLRAHDVAFTSINLVETPPTRAQLAAFLERSGLKPKALFNTSGASYRAGGFKSKLPAMSVDEMLDALAADGKLIKRPIVDIEGGTVLVGFKEQLYEEAFGK